MAIRLGEWMSLSRSGRHRLVIKLFKTGRWDDYETFVFKAAGMLQRKLKPFSEVTCVRPIAGAIIYQAGPHYIPEHILHVYTLLPKSVQLAQLPAEFRGFGVQQVNLKEQRDAYLATWKRLFKELKGWDGRQTFKWAAKWDYDLKDGSSVLYHKGPIDRAVPSLVDENVKKLIGKKIINFYHDIQSVIEKTDGNETLPIRHPDTVSDYNWSHIRKKIGEVVKKYSTNKA